MNPDADDSWIEDLNDLELAIRTTVAVLITAAPEDALSIARVIADQWGWSSDLLVWDFGPARHHRREQLHEQPPLRRARILLLREVHDLTAQQQAQLMDLLDSDAVPGGRPRIIASSSVSLWTRVQEGAFDERLFYRLNAIHLTTPAAASTVSGPLM